MIINDFHGHSTMISPWWQLHNHASSWKAREIGDESKIQLNTLPRSIRQNPVFFFWRKVAAVVIGDRSDEITFSL